MELRQLEYFAAVAHHGQFTRAARELNVAQPAISQQIKRLESEIGLELFNRSTRRVELTDAGSLLLGRALRILAEVEGARQEMSEVTGLLRGRVAIGALPVSRVDAPGLLQRFLERHPGIGIHLHEQALPVMLPMLRRDELDVCFALARHDELGDDIDGRFLYEEELVAVTSPGHRLAKRKRLELADLVDEPLIRFRTGSALQAIIDAGFDRAGVSPAFAFESFEMETVRALASRGLGVALLPAGYLLHEGAEIASVPLSPTVQMPVSLLWRKGRRRPPAAQAFLDFALEEFNRVGALDRT
jgi:LysR family transcriptional activator of glutamate synthase operon